VLLILSALLLTSLYRISELPRGFEGDAFLITDISLPMPKYQGR